MGHVTVIPPSSQVVRHEGVDWHLSADIESEITTLAAVCQVDQPQRTPLGAGKEENIHDDDNEGDEQVARHDVSSTNVNACLTGDDAKSIKMVFLDRLAELLCYKKHAHYVTCTSLLEGKGEVTIFAARNATWKEKDHKLLESLANMLELTATGDIPGIKSSDLREDFSNYYTPRLRYHAEKLLNFMGKREEMKNFATSLKDFLSGKIPSQRLVKLVDEISHNTDFYSLINRLFTTKQVKKQVRELGSIRRPETSYATFYQAARKISNFQRVKIKLLEGFKQKKVPPNLSLRLQLQSSLTWKALESELRKPKWVHAEMRMILHLISTDCAAQTFSYLGISKKTCFMCGHILLKMDMWQARNNHGKVYSQWTLPSSLVIPFEYQRKLELSVQNLRDVLQHESTLKNTQNIDAVKESTISTPVAAQESVWSPFSRHIPDPRLESRETEWLSLHSPRARAARTNQINTSNPTVSFAAKTDETQILGTARIPSVSGGKPMSCAQCGTRITPLTPCPQCESTLYCSINCRAMHWSRHKYVCRLGRPLDEADDFILACQEEEFPTDEPIARAFGFLYFTSAIDRQRLFRIYCQLVNRWGVGEEELREAWQQNKLKKFILFRGSQLPYSTVQNDIRWLSQQSGFASNAESDFSKFIRPQIDVLTPEDRNLPYYQLKPRQKLEAYMFLCQLQNGFVPDADEDNWISLGFCTARNNDDVQQIAYLYRALLKKCEFEEFWKAMEGSSMVDLFKKNGLGRAVTELRNFEALMSAVSKWYQSVWELKRFTRLQPRDPMRAIVEDYGFCNCQTPQERIELQQIYTKFFAQGGDEMALHEACIKGQLEPFLESELGDLHFAAGLVSNHYPLKRCEYMGMVVGTAFLCAESMYENAMKLQKEAGGKGVILTFPDEYDEGVREVLQERAEFLRQSLRTRTTTVQGDNISISEL